MSLPTFKQFLEAHRDPEEEDLDYSEYAGMEQERLRKKHELDKALKVTADHARIYRDMEQRSNMSRSGIRKQKKSNGDKK